MKRTNSNYRYTSANRNCYGPEIGDKLAYNDGWMYITADDGSADDDEPDHVYKCFVDPDLDEFSVLPRRLLMTSHVRAR